MQFCLSYSQFLLILTEYLLILSNLKFLSFFWFQAVLHSCDFSIIERIFCCNHRLFLTIFYLSTQLLMFQTENETIEVVILEWRLDDLRIEYEKFIVHRSFDKLRRLFQSFSRFWSVITVMNDRDLKWLTLVVENINEIEWLKLFAVIVDFSLCWIALLLKLCLETFFENFFFVALQARTRSLDWVMSDNRVIQSFMIAIFSYIVYSLLLDLFLVQIFVESIPHSNRSSWT